MPPRGGAEPRCRGQERSGASSAQVNVLALVTYWTSSYVVVANLQLGRSGTMGTGKPPAGGFSNEEALVACFLSNLGDEGGSPWGAVSVATEFYYMRGRADVVAVTRTGEVLAFEAKLTRWRTALHQAYRNRCFAHRSFVVLPEAVACAASEWQAEFTRRGIGLCFVDGDRVVVLVEPASDEPLQLWLSHKATQYASGASGLTP